MPPARRERRPNMNPALSLSTRTGPQTLPDAKDRHFDPASRLAFANLPLIRIYSTRLTCSMAVNWQTSLASPANLLTLP
jgi:hypothetical protein